MLVLTRKLHERIELTWRGERVIIEVASFRTGGCERTMRVQLGIDAPQEVRITRPESPRAFTPEKSHE